MTKSQPTGMTMTAVLGAIGNGHLTIEQLAEHLPIARKNVVNAACRLTTRGLIERVEIGHYQLTREGKLTLEEERPIKCGPRGPMAKTPRQNSFRQRCWRAMKLQQRFTVPAIVTVAARDKDKSPGVNLSRYLRALCHAGYVAVLPGRAPGNAETSNGFKVYRLIKDTGDLAPVYKTGDRKIYDHNTREELSW